jgi:hypothetical protein
MYLFPEGENRVMVEMLVSIELHIFSKVTHFVVSSTIFFLIQVPKTLILAKVAFTYLKTDIIQIQRNQKETEKKEKRKKKVDDSYNAG